MMMQGEELKALRKSIGMTQGDLANVLGLSPTFIGLMERGEKPIEPRTAQAAQYIQVCAQSNTMIAAAQLCRRAARREITLDPEQLEQIADWLDRFCHLPRHDIPPLPTAS